MRILSYIHRLTLAAVWSIAFVTSAQAAWFMKIATIPGTAKEPAHAGWIELQGFSWRPSPSTGAVAVSSAGATSGKAGASECSSAASNGTAIALKRVDDSSQKLSQAMAAGARLGTVTVQQTDAGGAVMLNADLTDVRVTGNAMTVGGESPTETIKLAYATIKVSDRNPDCASAAPQPARGHSFMPLPPGITPPPGH